MLNHYPDGYYGPRVKIDPTYRVDICYINSNHTATWVTDTSVAKAALDFYPDEFVKRVRHLAPGYFAIDHNRRKSVGKAWPVWNDLATELVRRGLATLIEDVKRKPRPRPKGFG